MQIGTGAKGFPSSGKTISAVLSKLPSTSLGQQFEDK